jgi:hypothetical protein
MPDKPERLPVPSFELHPELTPPDDPQLIQLLQSALSGNIPVYFAAIPLRLIRPFSTTYDPRRHPVGRQLIADVQEQWEQQVFQQLIVYQQGDAFIMSDDYAVYYAALAGNPDYVPCWVLGECASPNAVDVQGPIRQEELAHILLGAR